MHGISSAAGAPPQTPLRGAHFAPTALPYQGGEGKGREREEGERRGGKREGREGSPQSL